MAAPTSISVRRDCGMVCPGNRVANLGVLAALSSGKACVSKDNALLLRQLAPSHWSKDRLQRIGPLALCRQL